MNKIISKNRWLHLPVVLSLCVLSLYSGWDPLHARAGEQGRSKPASTASGPIVDIPASTHDLGVILSKGTTYHHDFLILNVGSEVLEIREVVVG
jgi:hypothetical protein